MDTKDILAHRGLWSIPEQQNSAPALETYKYGLETDVRINDCAEIYISHDKIENEYADGKSKIVRQNKNTVAINIKEPGMLEALAFEFGDMENSFFFDFELVDSTEIEKYSKTFGPDRVACRVSLGEQPTVDTLKLCNIIWLDCYYGIDNNIILDDEDGINFVKSLGKKIYFVSPELHGKKISEVDIEIAKICTGICTDYPVFWDNQLNTKHGKS